MHRPPTHAGSCAAATLVLAACAAPPAQPPAGRADVRVPLAASAFNAGEIGEAQLIARDRQTDVVVMLSGVTATVARPVHLVVTIHPGSCARPGAQPAYALTGRVLARRASDGFLTLGNTLPVSLATLRGAPHALLVRASPADANVPLFCGDLPLDAGHASEREPS